MWLCEHVLTDGEVKVILFCRSPRQLKPKQNHTDFMTWTITYSHLLWLSSCLWMQKHLDPVKAGEGEKVLTVGRGGGWQVVERESKRETCSRTDVHLLWNSKSSFRPNYFFLFFLSFNGFEGPLSLLWRIFVFPLPLVTKCGTTHLMLMRVIYWPLPVLFSQQSSPRRGPS